MSFVIVMMFVDLLCVVSTMGGVATNQPVHVTIARDLPSLLLLAPKRVSPRGSRIGCTICEVATSS